MTIWYSADEIKDLIGEFFIDPAPDGKSGEICEPYINGKRYKFRFDKRRKKPFGVNREIKK